MLRGNIPVLGRRLAHTRPKKVKVQLLKDIPRWGQRGEVLNVSEGLMRNKLHRHGAVYILPGEELRIPLKKRVHRHREPVVEVKEEEVATETSEAADKPSLLDLLQFPGGPTQPKPFSNASEGTGSLNTEATNEEKQEEKKENAEFDWMNEYVAKATKHKN